jgi:hypothetical protein
MNTYAFPSGHDPKTGTAQFGMNLRDYFAARALHSLMNSFKDDLDWNAHEEAKIAYEIADAMMKAREL